MDYHRNRGLPVKIARFFNTYGPHLAPDDGRVIGTFIRQALTGQDLTVQGDGSQTRSFCYVDDLVKGVVAFMETEASCTGPLNLGNPEEISIRHVAQHIITLCGSRSTFAYSALPQDDPKRRCPDITLARALLEWSPTTSFETGVAGTAEWFRAETEHA